MSCCKNRDPVSLWLAVSGELFTSGVICITVDVLTGKLLALMNCPCVLDLGVMYYG